MSILDRGCSCHIAAPCSFCIETMICSGCEVRFIVDDEGADQDNELCAGCAALVTVVNPEIPTVDGRTPAGKVTPGEKPGAPATWIPEPWSPLAGGKWSKSMIQGAAYVRQPRIYNRPDFQYLFSARGPGTVEIFAGPQPENPDWKRSTMIGAFEIEDVDTLDYIKAGVTPVALDQWEVVHLPSGEALDGVVEANAKERWIERYISPEQVDALIAAGRMKVLILHPGESARERVEDINIRIQRKRT